MKWLNLVFLSVSEIDGSWRIEATNLQKTLQLWAHYILCPWTRTLGLPGCEAIVGEIIITRLVKLVVFPDFKHGLPREPRVGGFSSSSEQLKEKPRCSNSLDTCALRAGLARRVLMVGLGFERGCFCFCSSVFCCCRVINLALRRATSVSHSRASFLALTHAIYCGG